MQVGKCVDGQVGWYVSRQLLDECPTSFLRGTIRWQRGWQVGRFLSKLISCYSPQRRSRRSSFQRSCRHLGPSSDLIDKTNPKSEIGDLFCSSKVFVKGCVTAAAPVTFCPLFGETWKGSFVLKDSRPLINLFDLKLKFDANFVVRLSNHLWSML